MLDQPNPTASIGLFKDDNSMPVQYALEILSKTSPKARQWHSMIFVDTASHDKFIKFDVLDHKPIFLV